MTPEETARLQERLEKQLAELRESSCLHQAQMDESQSGKDFVGADRAAELESMEVDSAVAESELRLAEKIEHALTRIEEGTYGLCEACGASIPVARLEAKPSVSLCVPCQEEHEAGRSRT